MGDKQEVKHVGRYRKTLRDQRWKQQLEYGVSLSLSFCLPTSSVCISTFPLFSVSVFLSPPPPLSVYYSVSLSFSGYPTFCFCLSISLPTSVCFSTFPYSRTALSQEFCSLHRLKSTYLSIIFLPRKKYNKNRKREKN